MTAEMVTKAVEIDIPRIVLDVKRYGRALDTTVTPAVLDLKVKETMSGAPTLELVLHDPDYRLLDSDVLWERDKHGDRELREIRVEIDDHGFILANCRWNPAGAGSGVDLRLIFEHELAYYMKKHRGARKARRGRVTLAEFMKSLSREIKEMRINFLSPSLHKRQPIERASQSERRQLRDARLDPGLADGEHITVKHVKASPAQVKAIDAVLSAGAALGVKRKLLVVSIMVITQESDVNPGAVTGNHIGLFQQEPGYGTVAERKDPYHSATAFFRKAMAIDKAHPSLSYAELAERVEISGRGSLYEQWRSEAERTVKAFGGSGGEAQIAFYKAFNYSRRRGESTWGASQRWAQEVNWRSFVRGRNTWVFASEPDLFRARPQMILDREQEAVLGTEGDIDRNKPAQTITATAHIDKWKAPAGSVVVVRGYGPGDGRWLVEEVERSYFRTEATIVLKRPSKAKPEPREELVTASLDLQAPGGGNLPTAILAAYREAYIIDRRNYPYVWGGGHGAAGRPSGSPPGFDCSGYVCAILAAGHMGFEPGGGVTTSIGLESWGSSGKGKYFTVWANGEHTWIQWHIDGAAWRADTSPHGDGPNGPHLRGTARETGGFVARHWPGF